MRMIRQVVRGFILILLTSPQTIESFAPEFRGNSRIFLDSGDEAEWDMLLRTGIFHGVTTNPFVLLKDNQACTVENVQRLADKALLSVNEFMCQTWGSTADEMYQNGMSLSSPARDRIVIKVPVTIPGIQAAAKLIRAECRVCLTSIYDHKQALTGVAMGAEYLAPCIGLISDVGRDGPGECLKMLELVNGVKGRTKIINACIRDVEILTELACAGMETFSFSPDLARQVFVDPLTLAAANEFQRSAEGNQGIWTSEIELQQTLEAIRMEQEDGSLLA